MGDYTAQFQPPMLNGRPTQAPLNRDQQKSAFEQLKGDYFKAAAPAPQWSIPAVKEYKLSEEEQLKAAQAQMKERGLQVQVAVVEERLEEKQTQDRIKSFYCRHEFQIVKAQWMVLPIKYKICSKCGLVK
jgi:hypothetical protein